MKPPKVTEIEHIKGLLKIELGTFYDHRGYNFEGFNREAYVNIHPAFKDLTFPVDSFSKSSYGVLRGFHGDFATVKLIQVLVGYIQFVVIDCRPDSPTVGHSFCFYLRSSVPTQILVPSGCVNAHLCLSDESLFSYKLSQQYVPQDKQLHIHWATFPDWEIKMPTLSARDA